MRVKCSLPMYDLPELRASTTRLWRYIASRLRPFGLTASDELDQPDDLAAHWRDPSLLLSQSCGYPLLSLPRSVRVVATPVYDAVGCDGAWYRSAIVVHRDHPAGGLTALRDTICAVNAADSNSGMNMLRAEVAPLAQGAPFFRRVTITGSHVDSLRAVATGEADVAAIDCVTLALLGDRRPDAVAAIRILGWTMPSPGLPMITAGNDQTLLALREALDAAARDPALGMTRRALRLLRFEVLPPDSYSAVRALEDQARAANYPTLA